MKLRSPLHRKFVAEQACIISGRQGEGVQSHHLLRVPGQHGLATKASDIFCVPLYFVVHDALHRNGNEVVFFANHGLDYELVVKIAMHYAKISPCPDAREAARVYEESLANNLTVGL